MSRTTQGNRRPDNLPLKELAAGDYSKRIWPNGDIEWYIRDPAGRGGAIGQRGPGSNHEVSEHEDGTITVSPSILDPRPGGWHGFLERGIWREC